MQIRTLKQSADFTKFEQLDLERAFLGPQISEEGRNDCNNLSPSVTIGRFMEARLERLINSRP